MSIGNPAANIQRVVSEPYSLENALLAYKSIHKVLHFDFIEEFDYLQYNLGEDEFIKTPLDMVVATCMNELYGLTSSALDAVGSDKKAKYSIDMDQFVDSVIHFAIVTVTSSLHKTEPVELSGQLSKKTFKDLSEKDKNSCLVFDTEANIIVTLLSSMTYILYSEEASKNFLKMVDEWIDSFKSIFATAIGLRSMQGGQPNGR